MRSIGNVFAIFDQQDSGNVSFGVAVNDERFFVKTAGAPANPAPYLPFAARVELLQNAARIARALPDHAALIPLRHVIDESPHGPLLVYNWANGELLGVPRDQRDNPESAFARFRALPVAEIVNALTTVFALHGELAAHGYIACDFYDGCLLYDFARQAVRVMDLDTYHRGTFVNTMGRMFGSARFMAPEEFERGAVIDERTTVFTLGRCAVVFLADGTLNRAAFRASAMLHGVLVRACRATPEERYATVASFFHAWNEACGV